MALGCTVSDFMMLDWTDNGISAMAGSARYPQFLQGDAMVFCSHKYHGVTPVIRGTRRVCVLEFWTGEERTCPHRCKQRTGTCKIN